MQIPRSLEEGFAQAALLALLRSGQVQPDALLEIADDYATLAEREAERPDLVELLEQLAHNLRLMAIDFAGPPEVAPEVERMAEFRRRQIRERTAALADGGNREI